MIHCIFLGLFSDGFSCNIINVRLDSDYNNIVHFTIVLDLRQNVNTFILKVKNDCLVRLQLLFWRARSGSCFVSLSKVQRISDL